MSWKKIFRRGKWDQERAAELEAHIQIETAENIARGMSADDARCAALKKIGNTTRVREEIYSMNTIGFVETLTQDVRYALRGLRLNPAFAVIAIASLALGIGANTAIFSLLDQVMLRALPVQAPGQLVLLKAPGPDAGSIRGVNAFSYPMYRDLRDQNNVFSGVLARWDFPASLAFQNDTQRVKGEIVSGNYFQVLGVLPALGRTFTADDDRNLGGHPLVVLSYGYWQRRFGHDPSIIGQTVAVNQVPMTVIGVSAQGFFGMEVGQTSDVFVPMMMAQKILPGWNGMEDRRDLWLNIVGRLKPGISPQQATPGMNLLFHQILQAEVGSSPKIPTDEKWRKRFVSKPLSLLPGGSGMSTLRTHFSTPLILLMGFVALVLLSACANLANLLMARGAARQKEIAIRLALGAARGRIVRQLLVESVLLSCCGGMLGIFLALWLGSALLQMVPVDPQALTFSARPDLPALLFTLAISFLTGVVFGLIPALRTSNPSLAPTLKSEATNLSCGNAHARVRKSLVVAQVALSLLLVIGAGLFAHSLYNLRTLDPGFQPDHLLQFSVDPALNGYTDPREVDFFLQMQERTSHIPGVKAISAAEAGLFSGMDATYTIQIENRANPNPDDAMNPHANFVGPRYFATLGIPTILGREFSESDKAGAPRVCLINDKFRQTWFRDQNPVGRHIWFNSHPERVMEIVGVVKDAKSINLRDQVEPFFYVPLMQDNNIGQLNFVVRTTQDPNALSALVRGQIQEIDNTLPIFHVQTMEAQVDRSIYAERMVAMLSVFFAGLAAMLAAVGLYGVMAFTVARRTGEIGIRLALGASRQNVLWMVMKEVVWMAALGVAIALPLALGLSRLVKSVLYDLTASDPLTLVTATAVLSAVALVAGLIPALRATRISPTQALRHE